MAQKDPLDEIVEELVVFKHEDPNREDRYFSNDPRFNDSRIRERWLARFGDDAVQGEQNIEDDPDEDEDPDYESWNNDDLRAELAGRNLPVDGKKADLIARLREDDEKGA